MEDSVKKYKEGHFLGLGIAIGVAIGTALFTPFFVSSDHSSLSGLGPALGISLGVAFGSAIEKKYKKAGLIIPLTEEEKAKQKRNAKRVVFIGISFLLLFALGALYLMTAK